MVNNQNLKKIFEISKNTPATRIDIWLRENCSEISRSKLKDLIVSQKVLINGKTCVPSDLVSGGEQIELNMPLVKEYNDFLAKKMDLEIVYEDNDVIVINKASGVVVHPGAGTAGQLTLAQGVLFYAKKLAIGSSPERPGVVHRLDKDTTGLIVFARNESAYKSLASQFANKINTREYVVLLDGAMSLSQMAVEGYISRDPKNRTKFLGCTREYYENLDSVGSKSFRYAKSFFIRKKIYGHRFTLAHVKLYTGRTHQIRVHGLQAGLPVLGDPLYNRKKTFPKLFTKKVQSFLVGTNRQMLHAYKLGFMHPSAGKYVEFECSIPQDFKKLLEVLEPYDIEGY